MQFSGHAPGGGSNTPVAVASSAVPTAVVLKKPDNAVMLTGGLGFSYNARTALLLTQTNLADSPTTMPPVPMGTAANDLIAGQPNRMVGLIAFAPNAQKLAAGYTGRRAIVEDPKCNKCHQEPGTFTEDAFHAGQRNDGNTCAWCHRPAQTSAGWAADCTRFVHAIHGAKKSACCARLVKACTRRPRRSPIQPMGCWASTMAWVTASTRV